MNPTLPDLPTVPPPLPPPRVFPRPVRSLLAACLAAAGADFLLWPPSAPRPDAGPPFLGFALLALLLAALVFWVRPAQGRRRAGWALPLLLAGAVAAGAIDFSFTNAAVLVVLLLALAGRTFFTGLGTLWEQAAAQACAFAGAFFRPLLVVYDIPVSLALGRERGAPSLLGRAVRACGIVLPALLLGGLFALLLGNGNAVLGWWGDRLLGSFWRWLVALDLSFGRFVFWGVAGCLALALFCPSRDADGRGSRWCWNWPARLRRFEAPEAGHPGTAHDRSVAILAVLNLVFLAANGADASFLWLRQTIPSGVTAASFVHEGTADLIVTTLLAGIVLALLFNQDRAVTGRPWPRALALAWIGQNLFLLSSVALRAKLYVDAYALSATRLSLLAFLALDAAGFVLLAVKIVREKPLAWLLGACAAAVFVLFYALQFLDFGGIAARYNVARWEREPGQGQPLDLAYLARVGPGGWEPLRRVASSNNASLAPVARHLLGNARDEAARQETDWRTWQARRAWNRRALAPLPSSEAP